jgi:hypothetical protein
MLKKTVVNVYKKNTKTYDPTGFGDYLRGCAYLYKLSKELNFNLEFDVSHHPISEYILTNNTNKDRTQEEQNNVIEFVTWWLKPSYSVDNYLKEILEGEENRVYIYVTDPYHNFWHNHMLEEDECKYLSDNIRPIDSISSKIDNILNQMLLTDFNILHIRTGDATLNNNEPSQLSESIIQDVINNKYNLNPNNTIILSDSLETKVKFKKYNFKTTDIVPVHTGISNTNLEGSLIEFYLMARAKSIYSISTYFWGSTYSTMCSAIYNIPIYRIPELSTLQLKDHHIKYCKSCDW